MTLVSPRPGNARVKGRRWRFHAKCSASRCNRQQHGTAAGSLDGAAAVCRVPSVCSDTAGSGKGNAKVEIRRGENRSRWYEGEDGAGSNVGTGARATAQSMEVDQAMQQPPWDPKKKARWGGGRRDAETRTYLKASTSTSFKWKRVGHMPMSVVRDEGMGGGRRGSERGECKSARCEPEWTGKVSTWSGGESDRLGAENKRVGKLAGQRMWKTRQGRRDSTGLSCRDAFWTRRAKNGGNLTRHRGGKYGWGPKMGGLYSRWSCRSFLKAWERFERVSVRQRSEFEVFEWMDSLRCENRPINSEMRKTDGQRVVFTALRGECGSEHEKRDSVLGLTTGTVNKMVNKSYAEHGIFNVEKESHQGSHGSASGRTGVCCIRTNLTTNGPRVGLYTYTGREPYVRITYDVLPVLNSVRKCPALRQRSRPTGRFRLAVITLEFGLGSVVWSVKSCPLWFMREDRRSYGRSSVGRPKLEHARRIIQNVRVFRVGETIVHLRRVENKFTLQRGGMHVVISVVAAVQQAEVRGLVARA
ncbi:hypothetical protein FB451DRAFT_1373197 [Mycena latifolia]|nr:hypothetical protein FB451DRAFT_1373197 [Mycena latifolia]